MQFDITGYFTDFGTHTNTAMTVAACLVDLLERVLDPKPPQLANSDGERPDGPSTCQTICLQPLMVLSKTPSVTLMSAKQQTLPDPQPGQVLRYAYLWADEQKAGREEGAEDRPCIVIVAREIEGVKRVVVVPVTRTPQGHDSIELPPDVKAKLGLDPGERSWAVCSEYNEFEWPGPDLRPIPRTGAWLYGQLPHAVFLRIATALRLGLNG